MAVEASQKHPTASVPEEGGLIDKHSSSVLLQREARNFDFPSIPFATAAETSDAAL
jgi:hypothetical protein